MIEAIKPFLPLVLIPIGAFLFRVRGDAIVGSTTAGRLLWAVIMSGNVFAATRGALPWWVALGTAVGLFIGSIFGWWGDCLDLGTNGGSRVRKTLWMTARGPVFALPAAPAWWWVDPWSAVAIGLAGIAAPFWFTVGFWWLPLGWRQWANTVGELGLGASIGAALAFAVERFLG